MALGIIACPRCGMENPATTLACARCGLPRYPPPPSPAGSGDDRLMRMVLPIGRSGLAIAAGYAGLFAIAILPGPIALALGLLAIRDLRRRPGVHGMGRAVFGLVMGIFGTAMLTLGVVAGLLSHD